MITTHRGLYRYNRHCFGLSSAPAIFQGIIKQILRPVKGVQPYLDDIALKGANLDDHLRILRHVFQTLRQAGVKLKREKCVFVQPSIKYLGHILSGYGLLPDPEKIVSNNGTPFTSREFGEFGNQHGIRHIRSAPYHPATNGEAERFVQVFKHALRANSDQTSYSTVQTSASKFDTESEVHRFL